MTEQNQPAGLTNVGIQQLNLSYSPEQDRLLFRVGLQDNSELQVWLTYRVTRQMWQLLSGKTPLPRAQSIQVEATPQQALQQFQQEAQTMETLQKMDFSTAYQPREKVQNNAALLAIQANLDEANPGVSVLHLACLEGMNVSINLNKEMTLAICNMLQLTTKEAGWDIGAPLALLEPEAPVIQKVLH